MKTNTNLYRKKYEKKMDSAGRMRFPAGGEDIHKLCNAIEHLLAIIRSVQTQLPIEGQNEVERRLWMV